MTVNKPDWLPDNPCEGCLTFRFYGSCASNVDCKRREIYQSNLAALKTFVEWLMDECLYSEGADGYVMDKDTLQSILDQIEKEIGKCQNQKN